jgi:DNA polymerase-3 subunit epsilon
MTKFDWLVAAFPETTFTVFDTETTGLEPKTNRVVEAGAIRFDARGIISRFNVLINPGMPMPAEVTKINGITDAMLAKQPAAAVVIPDFLRFIGDSVLIAHNAQFDINFMNEELARLGKPSLGNRVIDTLLFAREVFPGLPNYKLQTLATKFGITAIDAHRAEDDARVCMELFLVCVNALREKMPAAAAVQGSDSPMPAAAAASAGSAPVQPAAAAQSASAAESESEQEDLFGDEMDEGLFDEENPE